MKQSSTKSS